MLFNSLTFLVFFLVFFGVYWIVNNKSTIALRNLCILLGSYLFYGWWDWRFLGLILLSTAVDFTIGNLLGRTEARHNRKRLLICSIVINLGILGFFKYFNFFVDSLNDTFLFFSMNVNLSTLKVLLPVGISFYTFQSMSYSIDVYRRNIQPTTDILSFFAFVSFFPQLVAGPIERASHLLPQFQHRKVLTYDGCVAGLRLALWGFFKKLVIADNFGVLADSIFNAQSATPGTSVIAGSFFFALQIYADFSAYSDIAIGTARILGFDLMQNFKTPYFATSFGEFWQRWHISLSTWFRDYVYIPLGGNRKDPIQTSVNILITFLLSGLWHGANMTFLVWGGLHGMALIIEKQIKVPINKYVYFPIFLTTVVLLWLPFRAENLHQLSNLLAYLLDFRTYSFQHLNEVIQTFSKMKFMILMLITAQFLLLEYNLKLEDFNQWIGRKSKVGKIVVYYCISLVILMLGNFSVKPSFIYFQF